MSDKELRIGRKKKYRKALVKIFLHLGGWQVGTRNNVPESPKKGKNERRLHVCVIFGCWRPWSMDKEPGTPPVWLT